MIVEFLSDTYHDPIVDYCLTTNEPVLSFPVLVLLRLRKMAPASQPPITPSPDITTSILRLYHILYVVVYSAERPLHLVVSLKSTKQT